VELTVQLATATYSPVTIWWPLLCATGEGKRGPESTGSDNRIDLTSLIYICKKQTWKSTFRMYLKLNEGKVQIEGGVLSFTLSLYSYSQATCSLFIWSWILPERSLAACSSDSLHQGHAVYLHISFNKSKDIFFVHIKSLLTLGWSINFLPPQDLICVIWERSIKTMGDVQKVYCLVSQGLVHVTKMSNLL
jgi:hypothetical protein